MLYIDICNGYGLYTCLNEKQNKYSVQLVEWLVFDGHSIRERIFSNASREHFAGAWILFVFIWIYLR